MAKAVSGKGISAAVRASVHEWLTDATVDLMYEEYKRAIKTPGLRLEKWQFTNRVRREDDWVRTNRTKRYPSGWNRHYYSKQFSGRTTMNGVRMEVVTNADDTQITYVKIYVGQHLIGGGEVKVPSMLESQRGRDATLNLTPQFRPFTSDELASMQAEFQNSGDIALFADRDV